MAEGLFSASWYRVADLRPRLRGHAQIHRHQYRGELWYVVQNHTTGRFHRFTPSAYLIIGLMNGRRSMQEIWERAAEQLGDQVPTQQDVINLLAQLHRADLLRTDVLPLTEEMQRRDQKQRRQRRLEKLRSPLAIRIRLFDPDRLLSALWPMARWMFSGAGALLWLGLVAGGVTLAAEHWAELTEGVADRVLATQNLFLLWLIFPIVKALHELGHGLAVKKWGGEVHEIGIMLLVLIPVPYVDASASSAFREKHRRVVVGAAGIAVELLLAALALVVWLNVEPGVVRAVAFNVMLIAGVSAVVFNGNPLLRFDGYYVLSDLLEIPNLGNRANGYLGYLIQRYGFGVRDALSPVSAKGEAGWFVCYALTSFVYRMFLMAAIILFVAGKYFVVGIILALWAGISTLVWPLAKNVAFLFRSPRLHGRRNRALGVTAAAVAFLSGLITLVPVPAATHVQGIVWAPENSRVRAGTDAQIVRVNVEPGAVVKEGDVLFVCEAPGLPAEVRVYEAQLAELQARYDAEILRDRNQGLMIREEIAHVAAELARASERRRELEIRSPRDGVVVVDRFRDLPGLYVRRGDVLAYVMDYSQPVARVVVDQDQADLVRSWTRRVTVRPADQIARSLRATITREVPAATNELPSPALSVMGGGAIALDPQAVRDPRAFQKYFQFDLALITDEPITTIGSRVYVRFQRAPEPLAVQWYRGIRQLLLSRFDV